MSRDVHHLLELVVDDSGVILLKEVCILLVDPSEKELSLLARNHELVIELRADAEV